MGKGRGKEEARGTEVTLKKKKENDDFHYL